MRHRKKVVAKKKGGEAVPEVQGDCCFLSHRKDEEKLRGLEREEGGQWKGRPIACLDPLGGADAEARAEVGGERGLVEAAEGLLLEAHLERHLERGVLRRRVDLVAARRRRRDDGESDERREAL